MHSPELAPVHGMEPPPPGRFTAGNRLAQGRAHAFAKQAAALRRAFYAEVKPADMRALVRKLVSQALEGNLQAAGLVLL